MSGSPTPGWYPDPQDDRRQRWWDGGAWTEHVQAPAAPGPPAGTDASGSSQSTGRDTSMAALAHISAIPSAFIVLAFAGPLVVYLIRQQEPFARTHAAEALNFQLSNLLWLATTGVALGILVVATLGIAILLLPIYLVWGLAWLYLVIRASLAASRGEQYRYPLTFRFVS